MKLNRAELSSIVLALLAVASVLVVLATRHSPTTGERDARAKNVFPVWHEDEVSRIELESDGAGFALERAGEGFTLRAPEPEPADEAMVRKYVASLGFAVSARPL